MRSVPRSRLQHAGYTLPEVVVTIGLLAVLAGVGLAHLDPRPVNVAAAQQLVISALRSARADAITRGTHFEVRFTADRVQVARMQLDSGEWVSDSGSLQVHEVPGGVTIGDGAVDQRVEFNTRGVAINLASPLRIEVRDGVGSIRAAEVWPSGQVSEPWSSVVAP